MRLTETFIKNLKPHLKPKKYADGEGLFLFVTPSGVKSWRFRYRDIMSEEQEIVFGTYPLKSLLDARKDRFEARQLLENGKDPKEEKKAKQRLAEQSLVNTFKAVSEEWFELKHEHSSAKHRQKVWNTLQNHVFPIFGKRPIMTFDELELLQKVIKPLEQGRHTDLSHRIVSYCTSIFSYARITRRVPYNPLLDLKGALKPNRPTNTPAIRIEELPELLMVLENQKAPEIHKLAIKALMYTFARTKELRMARKAQFDLNKAFWIIPAHVMKKKRDHIIPLSFQAVALFKRIFELTGDNEYVFPTRNFVKHPYMNDATVNNLLHDMGYRDRHSGHGFRSLASTTLNELSWYDPQIIEKQLAHEEKNKVKAAYNRAEYLPQRIELMQRWADYIDLVVNNYEHIGSKNVA